MPKAPRAVFLSPMGNALGTSSKEQTGVFGVEGLGGVVKPRGWPTGGSFSAFCLCLGLGRPACGYWGVTGSRSVRVFMT